MNRLLLLVSFLLLQTIGFSQIDQQKLDSLSSHIDSSVKAYQEWQDSFTKAERQKSLDRSTMNTVEFMKNQHEKKKREPQQAMRYIIIGVILLAVLIAGLLRSRKQSKT